MATNTLYKVLFVNKDQVYEIYARSIFQSDLYGFIEVEELLFGEKSQLVLDPGEEKLKNEFAGVKRSYIPNHAVIRIDEVEQLGTPKISDTQSGNVTPIGNGFNQPRSSNTE